MTDAMRDLLEQRVLVLAPTGKDASLAQSVLQRAGIECQCCRDVRGLCDELEAGAGVVLLVEEAVTPDGGTRLVEWLSHQPVWSDLPILVLARPGADSSTVAESMDLLGNVTVLERPTRVAALVSAVRVGLRARRRQYQLREQLAAQKEATELQRRSVEALTTLLDTLPVGVFIAHDPECRRITGNRAANELMRAGTVANLSKTAPESERLNHFRVLRDGVEVPATELPVQRAARGETVRNEALDQVFDDGAVVRTLLSASPLYDSEGRSRGAVAAILDVTELKRREELLREADRRKDEFLAILAHELRNPLAPIRNSLHILRLTATHDPTAVRVGEIMERQVDHLVRLVDDLLEVSRITRGKIELRKELADIAAIVRSAVETSRPLIDAAGHQLRVSGPEEPLAVEGDPVRLAQVLANLLNNAAKYTEDEGEIWLTVCRDTDHVRISVRDTGMGIAPDVLPRVFDLFMQVDRDTDRSQGGMGIGLALVKSLVEMHGGSVHAHSEGRGRGSEFTVRLPLAEQHRTAAPLAATGSATELVAQRVLIVDDNHDAADSLGALLKLLGADVHVVYGGAEALEAVETYKPDAVILDIGMPGMDGHDVAEHIRARPELEDVTLIALTGWGQEADRRRAKEAGFDYHLIKPADVSALQALLMSLPHGGGSRRARR